MPERVVFDTNIWISGLLWRGKPYQSLLIAQAGLVQLIYCPEMTAELSRKLREPFGFSENQIQAVLYNLQRFATRIDVPGELHGITADPDDDIFIECAIAGQARLIVSGDHHLLTLKEYQNVQITNAFEFVQRFTRFP